MSTTITQGSRIAGIGTCVPLKVYDNIKDTKQFSKNEVRKVTALAGISQRRVAEESTCSSDLCIAAAEKILHKLHWTKESIDALIMVTQSPDYFLPSTACVVQHRLGLADECAAFDVGLGCSGYPYGLWLASMMIENGGLKRVLLLHGETPARFSDESDRSVSLLFGDTGSATAIEADEGKDKKKWHFKLHSDGSGYKDMIIEAGGFRQRFSNDPSKYCVKMNGANIFNFTIKRVPVLIEDTLNIANLSIDDIDYYIFHQSNKFIINHIKKKVNIPDNKAPLILKEFGNSGGPSIPLTITQSDLVFKDGNPLKLMLLGYGVGLSWGSALIDLKPDTVLTHTEI
jgi:3-oxoacyl-[acyl-carrier-protein] synthase-3